MRVSEIRVKRIRVNQGLGVLVPTGPWQAICPKSKTAKTVPPDIIVFLGGYGHTKFAMLNIFWCFLSSERVTWLVRGPYFKVKFALQKWSQTSPILILALYNMKQ